MSFVGFLKKWFWHDRNMRRAFEAERQFLNCRFDTINQTIMANRCQQRVDYLRDKILNSTQRGVSEEKHCEHQVIVSLTSFGKRIYDVCLAIESIMQGTIKPNRIVLWLAKDEFEGKTLPKTLQLQQSRGLNIEFCEDLRSYNKLVPSLRQYPEACVITIDDDVLYEYDIVERLVVTHVKHPDSVCACRMHKIRFEADRSLKSYLNWDFCVSALDKQSPFLFPTGVGGVLYPPHCLSDEVYNDKVFMDICPYADDVWFYAMALLKDTSVIQVYTGRPEGYYMGLPSSSIDALSAENTNPANCRNDAQIKAVFEKYNLYGKLL